MAPSKHRPWSSWVLSLFFYLRHLIYPLKRSSILLIVGTLVIFAFYISLLNKSTIKSERIISNTKNESYEIFTSSEKFSSYENFSSEILSSSEIIFEAWTAHYHLNDSNPDPNPPSPHVNSTIPPAPHIQDCVRLTEERQKLEMYDSEGNPPAWTKPSPSEGIKVPWVEGSDKDNLPLTHATQRDYWVHQHPKDCKSTNVRFLLMPWPDPFGHGLGSQLHMMSVVFSIAYALGRVFVPVQNTFSRSIHEGCTEKNYGSLNCYFFPMTYKECEEEAMRLWKLEKEKKKENKEKEKREKKEKEKKEGKKEGKIIFSYYELEVRMKGEGRLAMFNEPVSPLRSVKNATERWDGSWKNVSKFLEIAEWKNPHWMNGNIDQRTIWLRSQTIRYLLRWPSLRLCHLVNRERHSVYGKMVARQVAESKDQMNHPDVQSDLHNLTGTDGSKVLPSGIQSQAGKILSPFIFRPIVSVHVRQGDKASEMKLHPFSHYMFVAERIRFHSPDVKYVWLSTEMQTVIDESANYSDWTFFYSSLPRQNGTTRFFYYEKSVGLMKIADTSFVNLIISSECDYFIGPLGSNWNRLINELRFTNGRLKSGYVTLNFGDW